MLIRHESQVKKETVHKPGAANVYIQWLIGQDSGAPNFYLRRFQILPRGHTPRHKHPYEHEIYILKGDGYLMKGDERISVKAGTAILIPPNQIHQFKNPGSEVFEFLCLVPKIQRS